MVVFNECRIDSEGKYLIVEASVENLDYFKNVFIESIAIDTQDTFVDGRPSDRVVYSQTFDNSQYKRVYSDTEKAPIFNDESVEVYCDELDTVKRIRLRIPAKSIQGGNLNDNIFFIYVGAGGVPDGMTPCGMDTQYTMGVAINLRPIYNMAMGYIRELESSCETPRGFIDMVLRMKAFELALKTGNYPTALKWWNKLRSKSVASSRKNCGCNGIY
jgi:hypothetical protein